MFSGDLRNLFPVPAWGRPVIVPVSLSLTHPLSTNVTDVKANSAPSFAYFTHVSRGKYIYLTCCRKFHWVLLLSNNPILMQKYKTRLLLSNNTQWNFLQQVKWMYLSLKICVKYAKGKTEFVLPGLLSNRDSYSRKRWRDLKLFPQFQPRYTFTVGVTGINMAKIWIHFLRYWAQIQDISCLCNLTGIKWFIFHKIMVTASRLGYEI
jgi:hypothetical protein